MKGQAPATDDIPTEEGGYQKYKSAGKLQGKVWPPDVSSHFTILIEYTESFNHRR